VESGCGVFGQVREVFTCFYEYKSTNAGSRAAAAGAVSEALLSLLVLLVQRYKY
jgi:hypothetical protein